MFGQGRLQVALETMGSNRTIKGIKQAQRLEDRIFFLVHLSAQIENLRNIKKLLCQYCQDKSSEVLLVVYCSGL